MLFREKFGRDRDSFGAGWYLVVDIALDTVRGSNEPRRDGFPSFFLVHYASGGCTYIEKVMRRLSLNVCCHLECFSRVRFRSCW